LKKLYYLYSNPSSVLVLYDCKNKVLPYVFVRDLSSNLQALEALKAVEEFYKEEALKADKPYEHEVLYNVLHLNQCVYP
jgi:hypothetical protein